MTPPRPGTYIYHTHLNDEVQLSAGLYGAMIISAPENPFNSELDKVFVIGLLGETAPVGLRLDGAHVGINGTSSYQEQVVAGKQYRLRIVNITDNNAGFAVWLNSPAGFQEWTPVAQDGADYRWPYTYHGLPRRKLCPSEKLLIFSGHPDRRVPTGWKFDV
jgi:manganese oxidase